MLNISVIVPAFNVEGYVGETLASLVATHPPFSEIVVVDDVSTDGTRQVVDSFSQPNLSCFSQENAGLSGARNKGIELSTSDYIFFVDADDLIEPDFSYVTEALKTNGDFDVVVFSAIDFDDQSKAILPSSSYFKWPVEGVFETGREFLIECLKKNNLPAPVWLYVFSRKLLTKGEELSFHSVIHEDEVFTPELLMRAGRVLVKNQVLYKRRVRGGSIMQSKPSIKNVEGMLAAAKKWSDLARKERESERFYFLKRSNYFYARALRYAKDCNASFTEMQSLVENHLPDKLKSLKIDFSIYKISVSMGNFFVKHLSFLRS